jgi:hypothetical protein
MTGQPVGPAASGQPGFSPGRAKTGELAIEAAQRPNRVVSSFGDYGGISR